MQARLALAHLPTPLWRHDALDALVGTSLWVKRDDMTGGADAGNKLRKLEFLLADALLHEATTVITCGGLQSNHARATALSAAALDLEAVLLLRTNNPFKAPEPAGNVLLDRMAGADLRLITAAEYSDRSARMEATARQLRAAGKKPYVIPEGGSNALGALGYVEAMREVREQLDLGLGGGPAPFDAVVHACGSGGTAAGIALGAAEYAVAQATLAIAVCDHREYFENVTSRILSGASAFGYRKTNELVIVDEYRGPAYGVADGDQLRFMVDVARKTGLVLDPVYTGKALYGLSRMPDKPKRALFVHTGGLPGLLAQGEALKGTL